jgi:hypothetical protein
MIFKHLSSGTSRVITTLLLALACLTACSSDSPSTQTQDPPLAGDEPAERPVVPARYAGLVPSETIPLKFAKQFPAPFEREAEGVTVTPQDVGVLVNRRRGPEGVTYLQIDSPLKEGPALMVRFRFVGVTNNYGNMAFGLRGEGRASSHLFTIMPSYEANRDAAHEVYLYRTGDKVRCIHLRESPGGERVIANEVDADFPAADSRLNFSNISGYNRILIEQLLLPDDDAGGQGGSES